jgi:23S rRNA (adenine2503-C2)-methyltransferase
MTSLYDATREDIEVLLEDQPAFRITQIWDGLYKQLLEPEKILTLPAALRTQMTEMLPTALNSVTTSISDKGDTVKFLWSLVNGGHPIETVLMHYRDRATVCVSTQAGCAMACGFCATGQAGFSRHLTTGEIVEQVVRAAVWGAVERLHADIGLSARNLTISTVGIVPGIRTLADRPLPVNLAVSLHAARDSLRDELVPINKRYPLADLVQACADYLLKKNRRVSFEWAMIDGINDQPQDARELARLCKRLRPAAHVNLIPLNPTPGWPTKGTSPEGVREFARQLEDLGVNVTIRRNRGTDIDAACGQLAAGQPIKLGARRVVTAE